MPVAHRNENNLLNGEKVMIKCFDDNIETPVARRNDTQNKFHYSLHCFCDYNFDNRKK